MIDDYSEGMKGQYLKSDDPQLLFLYHFIDAPPNGEDGDFRSQHPYAATALCVTLVGAGATLAWPAMLGAAGFSSGGVVAGPCFTSGSFPSST